MRTRAAIASIVASTAVLIVGWDLGTAGTTVASTAAAPNPAPSAAGAPAAVTPAPTPSSSSSTFDVPTPNSTATPTPIATAPAASTDPADGTYTGTAISTRFGDVQVAITISGGSITDVTALELTDKDNRSVSLSNRAAPILRSEVLAAQTANVQAVSGATYTSDAYLSSLQSAIDQAGL